jgi:2-alkyl-3-oxoalkanoate reductase
MKVGVVGSGIISTHHLTAMSRYPGCTVVGIADRDIERARAQAARFRVTNTFDSIAELLNQKPDVVHVLTPPDTHEALVIQALAAGTHVYVEKPMAITVEACQNMARAAERFGRQLCVGQSFLYTPAMMRARSLLESGQVGEVVQASASFNYDVRRNPSYKQGHWAKDLPGGLAEDLAVHPASLLISLLGAPRQTLALDRSNAEIPDGKAADVCAILSAERGLGTLAVSLRARPDMGMLDIMCTRRMLRLNISSMAVSVYRDLPLPKKLSRAAGNLDIAAQLVGGTASATWKLLRKKVDGSYGIVPLIHAFYAALEAGKPAPVSPQIGAQAVGVMRAIWPLTQPVTRAATEVSQISI